jgi:hypothetical protein
MRPGFQVLRLLRSDLRVVPLTLPLAGISWRLEMSRVLAQQFAAAGTGAVTVNVSDAVTESGGLRLCRHHGQCHEQRLRGELWLPV